MYNQNSNRDWVGAAVMSMVGASLAASFSVSQGRDPLVCLVIVLLAIPTALILGSQR